MIAATLNANRFHERGAEMASRSLDDLEPSARKKVDAWIQACKKRGVDLLVYCTYRSVEEQADLYAQGRTNPGAIVTNAKPGTSWHNLPPMMTRAVDAVPIVHGKPDWSYSNYEPHWKVFEEEAKAAGLEWAGDWKSFREFVHVQDTDGMSLVEAWADAREAGLA